jgi:hypothetical protein
MSQYNTNKTITCKKKKDWDVKQIYSRVWMGLIWLRIWTSNVLLLKKCHKMWELLKQFGQKVGHEEEKT